MRGTLCVRRRTSSRVRMVDTGRPAARGCFRSRRRPMTVKNILSSKGRDVTTIEPNATLDTAIALLAQRRIGALVVLGPERRVIGILSERDIVRVLASEGAAALKAPLAKVMTRKVETCNEADTVSSLMEQMTA